MTSDPQWWLTTIDDTLVWARLRVLKSGRAEVLNQDGGILRYDDEDGARTALLDSEYRAFDGLDADDAELLGFDLEEIEPPRGSSKAELRKQMTQKIPS